MKQPMIKVSILYPNKPGTHFDMDYYLSKHMPLAMRLLSKGLRKTEVDAGLQGTAAGEPPAFFGGVQFYYDNIDAFVTVRGPAAAELTADIPKYTDSQPMIQFNEVKISV
jgi:uncharacterized protein (TIGR02118 family)